MTKLPKKLQRKLRSKKGVPLDEFCQLHPALKPLWEKYKAAYAAVEEDAKKYGLTVAEYEELFRK